MCSGLWLYYYIVVSLAGWLGPLECGWVGNNTNGGGAIDLDVYHRGRWCGLRPLGGATSHTAWVSAIYYSVGALTQSD